MYVSHCSIRRAITENNSDLNYHATLKVHTGGQFSVPRTAHWQTLPSLECWRWGGTESTTQTLRVGWEAETDLFIVGSIHVPLVHDIFLPVAGTIWLVVPVMGSVSRSQADFKAGECRCSYCACVGHCGTMGSQSGYADHFSYTCLWFSLTHSKKISLKLPFEFVSTQTQVH